MNSLAQRMVKHLSQETRMRILRSRPFRLYERLLFSENDIAFRCELTTRCNCNCEMCSRGTLIQNGKLPLADMDARVFGRVLEEMEKFRKAGKNVSFTIMGMGDPFVFKGLMDTLRRIKETSSSFRVVVVTNGILMDAAASEQLVAMGVDEVTVSLNTNSASDYKKRMGVDRYDQVVENIKTLLRIRNEKAVVAPSVIVQYLDYHQNMSLYDNDVADWLPLMSHADKCYIHPIVNEGGNVTTAESTFGADLGSFPCTLPLRYVAVNVAGSLYPCDACLFAGGEKVDSLYLGNILEDSPFERMQRKPNARTDIVERMRREDYSALPQCAKCNNYKLGTNIHFRLPGSLRIKGCKWM